MFAGSKERYVRHDVSPTATIAGHLQPLAQLDDEIHPGPSEGVPCDEETRASEIALYMPALEADHATRRQRPKLRQIIQYLGYDPEVRGIWYAHLMQAQVILRFVQWDKTLGVDASQDLGEHRSHRAGHFNDEGQRQEWLR